MPTDVRRITYAWVATSALTIVSWWLAMTRTGGHLSASSAETVAVLAICAVKARFIIRDFMEVRAAPIWLRRFSDGWLVVLWAAMLAIYLY